MEFVRKVLNEYLSIYLESNLYCRSVEILNKFFKIDLIIRFDDVELNNYIEQNQSKRINLLHRNFFKKKEQKDYIFIPILNTQN